MNFEEKKKEMMEKYEAAINAIAEANGVDVGVAFDMLVSNMTKESTYSYVNVEEFLKDNAELIELAKKAN